MDETPESHLCDICNVAKFDSLQKLSVHKTHCQKKNPNTVPRNERVPFGTPTKRFNVPDNDGYHYHIFNDNWRKEPGRIKRAQMAGYEIVEHERSGGTCGTNDDGSEIKEVLMRIPQELYDQDQALKDKELDKVDEQIYRGEFSKSGDDKRYLPHGPIKVTKT